MTAIRTLQRSFAGGEITPELYGRLDLTKYQTGLAECQNFVVLPHGPATARPGFQYIGSVKTVAKKTRLIPFSFSTEQTYVLEFGDQYVRIYTNGGQLLDGTVTAWVTATAYTVGQIRSNGGTNYYCKTAHTSGTFATDLAANKWYALSGSIVEIPTPYLEADLFDIHFVQSADVLALVHTGYAPRELRRLGAVEWELKSIQFAPTITEPTGVAVAATGTGSITYKYCVTSLAEGDEDESIASSVVSTTNNLNTAGNSNKVTWTNVSGAVRYRVYKLRGGIYAYVGQATDGTTGFVDDNITADLGTTPPTAQDPFASTNNYPQAVSYYEQRRVFAGTKNKPQTTWLTRTATESNMNRAIPSKDDDAMVIKLAAREANVIRHLVPMADLIMLTSSGEWKLSSGNADALTPTSVQIKPQSYTGASNVQPAVTGNSILHPQDRGAGVRELTYSWETQAYKTIDASIMAPHLFTGYTIKDMAFSRSPYSCLWVVRSDGVLLGLTYVPDQQVLGWHHHVTDGEFESVAVVSEGTEDVLYAVVKRTIGGNTKRYVERLHTREFTDQADAFHVDCGLTYDGSPATTFSGLSHLEGKTVSILADGAVAPSKVVTSGQVTIPVAASVVHIGLPIECKVKTLPVVVETQGFGQGRSKNVSAVFMRVYRSGGISAGPSEDRQTQFRMRTSEPYGTAPALKTEEIKIVIQNDWQTGGQVVVMHDEPLPMTLVSMSAEVEIGG